MSDKIKDATSNDKNEGGSFDKFINDIIIREESHRKKIEELADGQDDLPQRRHNKRYRELPQNRVVYRRIKK